MQPSTTGQAHVGNPSGTGTGFLFKFLVVVVCAIVALSAYKVWSSSFGSEEWKSFAEITILAIGLLSLRLVHRQLTAQTRESRAEFAWRKIQSYYEFFSDVPETAVNTKLYELAKELGIQHHFATGGVAVTPEVVTQILGDMGYRQTVCLYLDSFEGFAGAVRCGLVDETFAFNMESGRVVRTFRVFSPLIEKVQEENSSAYASLEMLAAEWEIRRTSNAHSWQEAQSKLGRAKKEQGAAAKGVL